MSTLWWLVVLWLVASFCFTLGWIVRVQFEVWHRMNDYIDFNRKRLGA